MNGIARITRQFAQDKVFVAYLTLGDGGIERSLLAAKALIEGGVTLLEIGMPFSDPIADGLVIQHAATRSLQNGTTVHDVAWFVSELRNYTDIPLVLFSYLNPLLPVLNDAYLGELARVGLDGVLVVDCPLEEMRPFLPLFERHALAPIFVIAPNTPLLRVRELNDKGAGFLYYACRRGVTGMHAQLPADFVNCITAIHHEVSLPVVAGFGIADRKAAAAVIQYTQGVVVGSLFVQAIADGYSDEQLCMLARQINPIDRGERCLNPITR